MPRRHANSRTFLPSWYQPRFPLEKFILDEKPRADALSQDVLIVGAGPAGLATAIELKKLNPQFEVGVLEKASDLGGHSLSGAIVDPRPFLELFPLLPLNEMPFGKPVSGDRVYLLTENDAVRVPTPSTMRNSGNYVASICEIVRWMGQKASDLGVNIFTGFPAESLLVEKSRVTGVRTAGRTSADLAAKVTVLAEGTRGSLTQAYFHWRKIASRNPQIYALGIKELWTTPKVPAAVIHTLGWPLPKDVFGGSWIYPLSEKLLSFGLVIGLDYRRSTLDAHDLLQKFKTHPLLQEYLQGGELLEWGAKTIPEGGFYSIPERLYGEGAVVVGDSAGFVNVASLKGIHYAVQSGIFAARAISRSLNAKDFSPHSLRTYDTMVRESFIAKDLYRTRNMRLAFKSGFYRGSFKAELMSLTRGRALGAPISTKADADEEREVTFPEAPPPSPGLSKVDAVFRSGNITRDDIPNHLVSRVDLPAEVLDFYSHLCPAGVYEREGDRLRINPANCIDCKATDILGPRWTPREGGSGPRYKKM